MAAARRSGRLSAGGTPIGGSPPPNAGSARHDSSRTNAIAALSPKARSAGPASPNYVRLRGEYQNLRRKDSRPANGRYSVAARERPNAMAGLDELLLERGLLTAGDLARANEVRRHGSARLPATLVRLGMVPETDLLEAQAAATGLPTIARSDFPETPLPLDDINPRFLARHAIAPVAFDDGRLTLAMADAEDE